MRGGTTKADFREAARHEHELNERQREVLALVAQGLTNAEIGERLGMSLDGAKWNVSEILSKLGLGSREEAAEYWRWRHEGVWARVRGWLGAPLLKVAGAGAATLVVGTIAVAAVVGGDESRSPDRLDPGQPFTLQAVVTVYDRARKADTPPDQSSVHQRVETQHEISWSYLDGWHARWEATATSPTLRGVGHVAWVVDGEREWSIDHDRREVTFHNADWVPGDRGIGAFIEFGPSHQPDLATFVATWKQRGDAEARAEIVGHEMLLGRDTVIVEYGAERPYEAPGGPYLTGLKRVWVDPETMMILKHETDSGRFVAEVTALEYGRGEPVGAFAFQPPAGYSVREVGPPSAVGRSSGHAGGGASVGAGDPFLEPVWLPDGFALREQLSEADATEIVYLDSWYALETYPSGPWVRLRQRRWSNGIPMSLRAGLDSPGAATDWWDDDGGSMAAWATPGGLAVVVSAEGLTSEEFEQVVESMPSTPYTYHTE